MADARLIVVGALSAGLLACQGREAAPPSTAASHVPPPAPAGERVGIADREWGSVYSARYSLALMLPERKSWQIEDSREPWFTVRHASSRAEMILKTWRAPRLVTNADCHAQVRLWQPKAPDPDAAPESVVEKRPFGAPPGYETDLTVGVRRSKTPGEIEGYVIAIGHAIGHCYAAIYTTRASGRGADQIVGDRLALATESIFPRVEKRNVEDRVR